MTYAEAKKEIDKIRNKDEIIFRMAISHLYDVGYRHLTEECVEETVEEIMQQDDSQSLMTNEYLANIVRTAYQLAQFDHIHLIVYIQREVTYDVFDGGICYARAIHLLKNLMNIICNTHYDTACMREDFEIAEFDENELEQLGYGFLNMEDEDE